MGPVGAALTVAAALVATEIAAAALHRFVMHGPLWHWHRSHHDGDLRRVSRNDLFALPYVAAALALFVAGGGPASSLWWSGVGVSLYGLLYAWVHDGLAHRRFPAGRVPARGLRARIVHAHRLHHAVRTRDGAVAFGFLWTAAPSVLARRLRDRRGRSGRGGDASGPARQTAIGVALALAILVAWALVHGLAVFVVRWDASAASLVAATAVIALQTWLGTGLFIVAHDAMHGSLAPAAPRAGRALGRVALAMYAGFRFDPLARAHHAHHHRPGTADDPDFDDRHPDRFWRWYLTFLRRYFGLREAVVLALLWFTWTTVLRAPVGPLLAFWAVPALLSSLQLFRWGTWLPHRHGADGFVDRHRARSSRAPAWRTLLACFHFGLHLEHHRQPRVPWWRLPSVRDVHSQALGSTPSQRAARPQRG